MNKINLKKNIIFESFFSLKILKALAIVPRWLLLTLELKRSHNFDYDPMIFNCDLNFVQ